MTSIEAFWKDYITYEQVFLLTILSFLLWELLLYFVF
jgi:hypothetical protein